MDMGRLLLWVGECVTHPGGAWLPQSVSPLVPGGSLGLPWPGLERGGRDTVRGQRAPGRSDEGAVVKPGCTLNTFMSGFHLGRVKSESW